MRINIIRFIKLLSIFFLINLYNVQDVKSSESGIEDGECIKTDINLIQELNNSLVEIKGQKHKPTVKIYSVDSTNLVISLNENIDDVRNRR